jgi:hypothetical protein
MEWMGHVTNFVHNSNKFCHFITVELVSILITFCIYR